MKQRVFILTIVALLLISFIGCSIPMRKHTNLPGTTPPEEFDTTFICVVIGVTAFVVIGPGTRALGMEDD